MRLFSVILLTVLVGCNSPEPKSQVDEIQTVDSVLEQSKKSFISADSISKQSDQFIGEKVTKTAKQISILKEEVKTLKAENNELKTKLDSLDDAGKPFSLLPISSGKDNR